MQGATGHRVAAVVPCWWGKPSAHSSGKCGTSGEPPRDDDDGCGDRDDNDLDRDRRDLLASLGGSSGVYTSLALTPLWRSTAAAEHTHHRRTRTGENDGLPPFSPLEKLPSPRFSDTFFWPYPSHSASLSLWRRDLERCSLPPPKEERNFLPGVYWDMSCSAPSPSQPPAGSRGKEVVKHQPPPGEIPGALRVVLTSARSSPPGLSLPLSLHEHIGYPFRPLDDCQL